MDNTKSCYQLIKTLTKFEKNLHIHYGFSFKKTDNSVKYRTTVRSHDTFCPLTQAWHVNCPITLSNYKHDAYTVLLVLIAMVITHRVQEFDIVLINNNFIARKIHWFQYQDTNCLSLSFSHLQVQRNSWQLFGTLILFWCLQLWRRSHLQGARAYMLPFWVQKR